MNDTVNKPAPILPHNNQADRPLLIVMSIMAFMASLALLVTSMSNRTSTHWQSELQQSATVQIYLSDNSNRAADLAKAMSVISEFEPALSTTPLSEAQSRDLIRPWIGDVELPAELPLPVMIAVDYTGPESLDRTGLDTALKTAGLSADVDDHSTWADRVNRAARAVRVGTTLILFLLLAGSIAAAGFATQSAMAVHRQIVKVLTQVGAQDRYIAQLFTRQFFLTGAKSGIIGIIGAFIFTFIISLLFSGDRDSSLLPSLKLSGSDLIFILLIPILFGVVSAIAAGYTSFQALKTERENT